MKKITKWIASLSLVICIIIPTLFIEADSQIATIPTGYTKASDVDYKKFGNYVSNWGARGEVATFLSTYAEDFYSGSTEYDKMSQKLGSATLSATPNSDLYKALQSAMKNKHKHITNYQETRYLYKYTDCVRNDTAQISSFYSGGMFSSTWDYGKTWNREHVWPNSKGDLAGDGENDIMMLRPTLSDENLSRSNKAYGASSYYYNPNGESGGKYDVRGDVSRVILYQYVRWGCINTGTKYNAVDIFGASGVIESLDVLLLWMKEDPVDTWEMGRNDAVQSITGTRNVFIDYPEYAWALFGLDCPQDITTPSGEAKDNSASNNNPSNNTSKPTASKPTSNAVSSNTSSTNKKPSSTNSSNNSTVINCQHVLELQNYREATCGDEGYSGDMVCTDCHKTVEEGRIIKPTGEHSFDQNQTCTVCGFNQETTNTIGADTNNNGTTESSSTVSVIGLVLVICGGMLLLGGAVVCVIFIIKAKKKQAE